MGAFDIVRCHYPIPELGDVSGIEFQTKCFNVPYQNEAEIRADGTIWKEVWEGRLEEDATSFLGHVLHRDNLRMEQQIINGEFEMHAMHPKWDWLSIKFWCRDGVVRDVIVYKESPDA